MAIIGIDLGTSNSAAVLRGGRPVIIPSAEGVTLGGKAFPSVVALGADGQMLVGEAARRQATLNPEGTATAFKRKMGRRETVRLREREFTPEQLSAFLLQKIKRDAEAFLGEPVEAGTIMPEMTSVGKAVMAAFERDRDINLHRFPIRLEFDVAKGALTLEGEVENIIAKKRAFEIACRMPGIRGVVDCLTVAPSERRGDGAIRDSFIQELLQEPTLIRCSIRVQRKGAIEAIRESVETPPSAIEISVNDGIVELNGRVPSLSHKRLAGMLAWWAPGCRDVIDRIRVTPPEADNDDEIADALRLVLEKDPLVHADRIGIRVHDRVVTLTGLVGANVEKKMAELDAWYLFGVNKVVNRIDVLQ